jgi:hypothetical protein
VSVCASVCVCVCVCGWVGGWVCVGVLIHTDLIGAVALMRAQGLWLLGLRERVRGRYTHFLSLSFSLYHTHTHTLRDRQTRTEYTHVTALLRQAHLCAFACACAYQIVIK